MHWLFILCLHFFFAWPPNSDAPNLQAVNLHGQPGMSHLGAWGEANYNSECFNNMIHPTSHICINFEEKNMIRSTALFSNYQQCKFDEDLL